MAGRGVIFEDQEGNVIKQYSSLGEAYRAGAIANPVGYGLNSERGTGYTPAYRFNDKIYWKEPNDTKMTVDKTTGKITVTGPKAVVNNVDFQKQFSEVGNWTALYQQDPNFKFAVTDAEGQDTGETETLFERVERMNTPVETGQKDKDGNAIKISPLQSITDHYLWLNSMNDKIGQFYKQIDEEGNVTAIQLSEAEINRMMADGSAEGTKDTDYISVPRDWKGLETLYKKASSWDKENARVTIEDFRKYGYNLDTMGEEAIFDLKTSLENYLLETLNTTTAAESVDKETFTGAMALYNYIRKHNPAANFFTGASYVISAPIKGSLRFGVDKAKSWLDTVGGLISAGQNFKLWLDAKWNGTDLADVQWSDIGQYISNKTGMAMETMFGLSETGLNLDKAATAAAQKMSAEFQARFDKLKQVSETLAGPGDYTVNTLAEGFEAVAEGIWNLLDIVAVGNVFEKATEKALGKISAKSLEAAGRIAQGGATTAELSAGASRLVSLLGAETSVKLFNGLSKLATSWVVTDSLKLAMETLGEGLADHPEIVAQSLADGTFSSDGLQYISDTFWGNAMGYFIGSSAMKIGNTTAGKWASSRMRRWMYKIETDIADWFDTTRAKWGKYGSVNEWLKSFKDPNKARTMTLRRIIREKKRELANMDKIKLLGNDWDSIRKALDEVEEKVTQKLELENLLRNYNQQANLRIQEIAYSNDHPKFKAINDLQFRQYGELVQAEQGVFKSLAKTEWGTLLSKETSNYIGARVRTPILNSALDLAKKSGNKKKVEAITSELKHWANVIAEYKQKATPELLKAADTYVKTYRKWWNEAVNTFADMGLISKADIAKWREDGIWGKNGELYARLQRKQPMQEYYMVRDDGKVTTKMTHELGHYGWGSTDDFVDPMLTMQHELRTQAEISLRNDIVKTFYGADGPTVAKTAEEVAIRDKVKPALKKYNEEASIALKPMAKEIQTEGAFNDIAKQADLKRAQRSATNKVSARTRQVVTKGEAQSALLNMDDDGIDTLWREIHGDKTAAEVASSLKPAAPVYAGFDTTNLTTKGESLQLFRALDDTPGALTEYARLDGEWVMVDGKPVVDKLSRRDYYAQTKGKAVAVVEMTPDDYIRYSVNGNADNAKEMLAQIEADPKTAQYAAAMTQGDQFPIGNIEYGAKGQWQGQEGRHRAVAAKRAGINTIPVAIEYDIKNPPKMLKNFKDVTEDFSRYITEMADTSEVSKRALLAQSDKLASSEYMKNVVIANRRESFDMIADQIAGQQAAREAAQMNQKVNKAINQVLDDFKDVFFSKRHTANDVANDIIARYGGNYPDTVREFLYYDALKKNKKTLTYKIKTDAEKFFREYTTEVGGKTVKPYADQAEALANDITKRVSAKIDVEFNAARNTMASNRGLKALVDTDSWQKEIYAEARKIDDTLSEANKMMMRNASGEYEIVEVDPLLAEYLTARPAGREMTNFQKVNYLWMKLFRAGTTGMNPTSMVNQQFRDMGNAWIMGNVANTLGGATDQISDIFGKNVGEIMAQYSQEVQDNFMALAKKQGKDLGEVIAQSEMARGAQVAKSGTETEAIRLMKKTSDLWYTDGAYKASNFDTFSNAIDKVTDKLGAVNEVRERYLRELVYANNFERAIKSGKSVRQARVYAEYLANNATTDFSQETTFLTSIQNSIPYLRSAINGTKSFWRLYSLDPAGVTGRLIGGVIMPTIALVSGSLNGEENRKAYQNIAEYQKENSLPIVSHGEVFMLPIPQELASFINPFRHAVEALNGLHQNKITEIVINDLVAFSPLELGGFTDIDGMNMFSQDGELSWSDRFWSGTGQLTSQIAPKYLVSAIQAMTGTDLYTGQKIDTTYTVYNPETGENEVMGYTAGQLAKLIQKIFPDVSAGVAQEVLDSIFGTAPVDYLDWLIELGTGVIDEASGQAGALGESLETIASDVAYTVTKPVHPYVQDRVDKAWRAAISELWEEKKALLISNEYQSYMTNARNANTATAKAQVAAQRANVLDPFYEKVQNTVNNLVNTYGGTLTSARFGSVVSLLNLAMSTASGNAAIDQLNSETYTAARKAAVNTMARLGFPSISSNSVWGQIKSDGQGGTYIAWATPLQVLDMQYTRTAQASIHSAELESILSKNNINSYAVSQVWDAYDKETDKEKKRQILVNWDIKVATAIAPYVYSYGVNTVLNNNDAIDYLDGLILVPSDYKRYKNRSVYSPNLNGQRGFAKQFILDVFGGTK